MKARAIIDDRLAIWAGDRVNYPYYSLVEGTGIHVGCQQRGLEVRVFYNGGPFDDNVWIVAIDLEDGMQMARDLATSFSVMKAKRIKNKGFKCAGYSEVLDVPHRVE